MSVTISHEPLERSYLVVEPGTHGDNYYRYTIIIFENAMFRDGHYTDVTGDDFPMKKGNQGFDDWQELHDCSRDGCHGFTNITISQLEIFSSFTLHSLLPYFVTK